MTVHQIISILLILTASVFLILKGRLFKRTGLSKTWRMGLFFAKILASLEFWLYIRGTIPKKQPICINISGMVKLFMKMPDRPGHGCMY